MTVHEGFKGKNLNELRMVESGYFSNMIHNKDILYNKEN